MLVSELPRTEFSNRLRSGDGLSVFMGPFVLRLQVALQELHEPLALLYADNKIVPEDAISDFQVVVKPYRGFPPWKKQAHCLIDGLATFEPFQREQALPMLEWAINWCTFSKPQQFFMLHSAVLEKNGCGILLPGPPGAGKSTLCAALALKGWRLLSDELALMRPRNIDLIPLPRPVGLKDESIEIIKKFAPGVAMGPSTPGTRKGTVAHMKPPRDALIHAEQTVKPRWIIFPCFRKGAETLLDPASKAQTFLWLANDAFNFNVLGEQAFDTLRELVDTCACHELNYGDLGSAVAFLDQMCEQEA